MRVAIDIRHVRDFGIGTYIRNLVPALARQPASRPVKYLLLGRPQDFESLGRLEGDYEFHAYPHLDRGLIQQLMFPWFYRRLKADLAHIPLNHVSIAMPRPYVVTIHDVNELKFPARSGLRQDWIAYRARRGLTRAARVLTVSAATRRDVEELLTIPGERIEQIYNAIDERFFINTAQVREEQVRVIERYQINAPFLLYAGTIRPHKNIPRLVEAFAVLRGELAKHPVYKDLRLVIMGDEISKNPALRRTVIQTRMEHAVRFLGFVPFETLRAFYRMAAVFVFPSLYEGFGLPPLEAMACGTPVVASNVSSLPEVVGDAAMIVNPENVFDIARGVREALLDSELRVELCRRGLERARQFNWDRTAAAVVRSYESTLRDTHKMNNSDRISN